MNLFDYTKNLIVETITDFTSNLVNGRIGFFSRKLNVVADGVWNEVAWMSDLPNVATILGTQSTINTNTLLAETDNLKTLIITASCTITVPVLADGFQISGYVKAGQTLTFANSGGTTFVGNNSVITVAEKQTFSLVKINGTTEFILKL